jgi:hypothetical protein
VPETPSFDFLAVLRTLSRHRAEFLVIGGVAAVLHGAPVATFDLDVVHSREPDNVARLLAALEELDAHYRFQPVRHIRPGPSHLLSPGHQLLRTRFGSLDLLGSVGSHSYQDLLSHSIEVEVGEGVRVQVVQLDWIIRLKEEAGAEKDLAVLPILRRTLEEKSR